MFELRWYITFAFSLITQHWFFFSSVTKCYSAYSSSDFISPFKLEFIVTISSHPCFSLCHVESGHVMICLSFCKCPYYSDLMYRTSGNRNLTVTCICLAGALFLTTFPFVWQSNSLNFLSAVFSWYSTHVNETAFWMHAWVLKFSKLHSM